MKTFSQFIESITPKLPELSVREQFFQELIFNLGDLVEHQGLFYTIKHRGTNHLVIEDDQGSVKTSFPQDLKVVNEDQYGADYTYSQTLNKDGTRRKDHINRIEFSNSGLITKSKKIVSDTKRVGAPLILKPLPIKNPYKNLIKDEGERKTLKAFVKNLDKTVHPEPIKKQKAIGAATTTETE